eukprot:4227870-Alexandrium_andersonii.AAC.1
MSQITQDAVDADIDEEVDARASALLKTLGQRQVTMGVCAFANTGLHTICMHMWRLMFVCTNEGCQHENGVALICARCKSTLP